MFGTPSRTLFVFLAIAIPSSAAQDWDSVVDAVSEALYSDKPLEQLSHLELTIATDPVGDDGSSLRLVRHAMAYYVEMSDSASAVYERERAFRQGGDIDTTFHSVSADLTGDSKLDEVFAKIERIGLRVFLTLSVLSESDTTVIHRHRISRDDSPEPVPQLHRLYRTGIECGLRPDLESPQRLFIVPSIMTNAICKKTGEPVNEGELKAYMDRFSGRAICIGNGYSGSCHVYYTPLSSFVLLYMP